MEEKKRNKLDTYLSARKDIIKNLCNSLERLAQDGKMSDNINSEVLSDMLSASRAAKEIEYFERESEKCHKDAQTVITRYQEFASKEFVLIPPNNLRKKEFHIRVGKECLEIISGTSSIVMFWGSIIDDTEIVFDGYVENGKVIFTKMECIEDDYFLPCESASVVVDDASFLDFIKDYCVTNSEGIKTFKGAAVKSFKIALIK